MLSSYRIECKFETGHKIPTCGYGGSEGHLVSIFYTQVSAAAPTCPQSLTLTGCEWYIPSFCPTSTFRLRSAPPWRCGHLSVSYVRTLDSLRRPLGSSYLWAPSALLICHLVLRSPLSSELLQGRKHVFCFLVSTGSGEIPPSLQRNLLPL